MGDLGSGCEARRGLGVVATVPTHCIGETDRSAWAQACGDGYHQAGAGASRSLDAPYLFDRRALCLV